MRAQPLHFFALAALAALITVPLQAKEPGNAIVKTETVGHYEVTLKVLPAESFTGPNAEMQWDGGAEAVHLDSPEQPNHHLVAFIKKDGVPAENAVVEIQYRSLEGQSQEWTNEPVARMHVKGEGPTTTHYGNNVHLAPGSYEVAVTVNTSPPAMFHFTLPVTAMAK